MIHWPWKTKTTESLGLDIGNTAIRLVRLVKTENRISIRRPIEIPILREQKETQQAATVRAIKALIAQLETPYRKISIALSDWRSLRLRLSIDKNSKDFQSASLLAASAYFSYPLDMLSFDFKIMSESSHAKEVEGVFYPKEIVQNYETLIKATGFKLTGIELTSHALTRGFQYLNSVAEYPDYWSCILLEPYSFTAVFLKNTVLEFCATDYFQENSAPSIAAQIHQKLLSLIGVNITAPPKVINVVGDHENIDRVNKLLSQNLERLGFKIDAQQKSTSPIENQWNSFYVALGLALREI